MASFNENNIKSKADWVNALKRTTKAPLDRSSIFGSYDDAVLYASGGGDSRGLGGSSYIGQVITVYENGKVDVYKIGESRNLENISPIIIGDMPNSAVLEGEYEGYSNKAISQVSVSLGAASTAGLKGWYYTHVNIDNKQIFLGSKRTQVLGVDSLTCTYDNILGRYPDSKYTDESFVSGYERGDVISIVYDKKFEDYATITEVNGNVITLDKVPFVSDDFKLGVCTKVTAIGQPDEFSVYCIKRDFNDTTKVLTVTKHDNGSVDFGGGSLSEGVQTYALNIGAHAEGGQTMAKGQYSHAEGLRTQANYAAHAEGVYTEAIGRNSHAEGNRAKSIGEDSHAEGRETIASNKGTHAEGRITTASGDSSHSEGYKTIANGAASHAEGWDNTASGEASHVEGRESKSVGKESHAEGLRTAAIGNYSHTEGFGFRKSELIPADKSTIEADWDSALQNNVQSGDTARFMASVGECSHAEGCTSLSLGNYSHAEGEATKAKGRSSHAEGEQTVAKNRGEHACGRFNDSTESTDKSKATQFSIGIGTSKDARKNAFEVKQNGDIYINGITLPLATLLSTADTDADVESVWNEL